MSHLGLLGTYQLGESADDIRGTTLYGQDDEKLGKIDDVIFDHSTGDIRYAVVDTGGWLTTKKFLVPVQRIQPSTKHQDDYASNMTKNEIERFPAYDEKDLDSQERWSDYENKYRAKWETGPVMHRAESDRNITPTTQQVEGNQSSLRASGERPGPVPLSDRDNQRLDQESIDAAGSSRIVPAGTDSVVIESNAVGIGDRWDTFQSRLRERRKEAATNCKTCSIGPATARDELKKAV